LFRNASLFAITDGVGGVLVFFGKLFTATLTTFVFYCAIEYDWGSV